MPSRAQRKDRGKKVKTLAGATARHESMQSVLYMRLKKEQQITHRVTATMLASPVDKEHEGPDSDVDTWNLPDQAKDTDNNNEGATDATSKAHCHALRAWFYWFFFLKRCRTAIYIAKHSENVLHTAIYGYIRDPVTFVLKVSKHMWHFDIRSVYLAKRTKM